MGKKKDKKEKKQKGIEKTTAKTEKKLEKKAKKMLQEKGEEDIEALIAQFQEQDRKRQQVSEEKCPPPSPRCNMSLTAHPERDVLMMFGGEYFDGNKTFLYNDLFLYNIKTNDWSLLKAPNPPAPRCAHQAVALHQMGGQLWIFGGEFASPTQSQFYHYKDLWVLNLKDCVWQKINTVGGPSSRSGHRMVACQKMLFVFGGFHESTNDYRYFNDLHAFNVETYKWIKLDLSGIPPSPRSACVMTATQDQSRIVIYGGYSKERVKRDVDRGQVHTDMYALTFDNKVKQSAAATGGDDAASDKIKLKWQQVKQTGSRPSPRSSCTLISTAPNSALLFGGVFDEEEDDETVKGKFYNEMYSLELDKGRWHLLSLRKRTSDREQKRRRRKEKASGAGDGAEDQKSDDEHSDDDESQGLEDNVSDLQLSERVDDAAQPATTVTTYDDGIFTVTISGPRKGADVCAGGETEETVDSAVDSFVPCPRMNSLLAIKHGTLYLYGGVYEVGDRQVTLNDFYAIDLHRFDEWRTIIPLNVADQEWFDTDSSDEDEEDMETDVTGLGATGGSEPAPKREAAAAEIDDDDEDEDDDDDTSEDEVQSK
jgi:hypothetical protein